MLFGGYLWNPWWWNKLCCNLWWVIRYMHWTIYGQSGVENIDIVSPLKINYLWPSHSIKKYQYGVTASQLSSVFLFVWMFYDHLSAHSLLAKLGRCGWLMRMRLACKKSQKTIDTSKRLNRHKTRSTGSANKGTWSQRYHYWDCGLGKVQVRQVWRHLARVWNSPDTQGGGVQKF